MKYLKKIFSRFVIFGLLLILQFALIIFISFKFTEYFNVLYILSVIAGILMVLYINFKDLNPAYKLAWIILIFVLPFCGVLAFAIGGNKRPSRKLRFALEKVGKRTNALLIQNNNVINELEEDNKIIANQTKYLSDYANSPIYKKTKTKYYKLGDDAFVDMIKELKKAKHYIFLEYFIVHNGKMWDSILNILEEKVKEGVDVRMIYDDVGSLSTLNGHYYKELEEKGIKCFAFNPFKPFISLVMNNRDHRKILVIDGHTAFTGGINLADEYINETVRFGHWKDSAVMIKGEAVWTFTLMFLQMWDCVRQETETYEKYRPNVFNDFEFEDDGFVQPYGDSPLDEEIVGENVYLNILNNAKDYVYISTPYLIIDNEMSTALTLAAKRGVDVRIITPEIPDKKTIFALTKSFYPQLIKGGVKIYQYKPGFIHAKSFLADDKLGTVGTINLDFRSLYLHFECGVYMYKSSALKTLKEDYIDTFKCSREITLKDCRTLFIGKLYQSVLRLFAALV